MLKVETLGAVWYYSKNLILRGIEPLSLSFFLENLERAREKGRRGLEVFEDHHHLSSVWSINSFPRYVVLFLCNYLLVSSSQFEGLCS